MITEQAKSASEKAHKLSEIANSRTPTQRDNDGRRTSAYHDEAADAHRIAARMLNAAGRKEGLEGYQEKSDNHLKLAQEHQTKADKYNKGVFKTEPHLPVAPPSGQQSTKPASPPKAPSVKPPTPMGKAEDSDEAKYTQMYNKAKALSETLKNNPIDDKTKLGNMHLQAANHWNELTPMAHNLSNKYNTANGSQGDKVEHYRNEAEKANTMFGYHVKNAHQLLSNRTNMNKAEDTSNKVHVKEFIVPISKGGMLRWHSSCIKGDDSAKGQTIKGREPDAEYTREAASGLPGLCVGCGGELSKDPNGVPVPPKDLSTKKSEADIDNLKMAQDKKKFLNPLKHHYAHLLQAHKMGKSEQALKSANMCATYLRLLDLTSVPEELKNNKDVDLEKTEHPLDKEAKKLSKTLTMEASGGVPSSDTQGAAMMKNKNEGCDPGTYEPLMKMRGYMTKLAKCGEMTVVKAEHDPKGIQNPNSSGQGYHPNHADHPYHDTIVSHGYEYSHSTPITGPSVTTKLGQPPEQNKYLSHTYKHKTLKDHNVSVTVGKNGNKPHWAVSVSGSGLENRGNDNNKLNSFLKGHVSRANKKTVQKTEDFNKPFDVDVNIKNIRANQASAKAIGVKKLYSGRHGTSLGEKNPYKWDASLHREAAEAHNAASDAFSKMGSDHSASFHKMRAIEHEHKAKIAEHLKNGDKEAAFKAIQEHNALPHGSPDMKKILSAFATKLKP